MWCRLRRHHMEEKRVCEGSLRSSRGSAPAPRENLTKTATILWRTTMTQHWGLRCWFCTASAALSTGLLIAVVSMGLVACGYNGSDQGRTSSTQSPAQVTHSPAK